MGLGAGLLLYWFGCSRMAVAFAASDGQLDWPDSGSFGLKKGCSASETGLGR